VFDKEFLTMMPDTVIMIPVLAYDRNNEVSEWGTPTQYRCRITGKHISLRRPLSQDESPIFDIYLGGKYIDGELYLLTDLDTPSVDSKIHLPGGDARWIDGTPEIFAVALVTDEFGRHHVKVQCGWMYHRQGQ